jgi:hypothetical protein
MAFCNERKSQSNEVNRTFIVCNMCELAMHRNLDPMYVIYSSSKISTFGVKPLLRGTVFNLVLLDTLGDIIDHLTLNRLGNCRFLWSITGVGFECWKMIYSRYVNLKDRKENSYRIKSTI